MSDQLTELPGIGPKTAEKLRSDGINTPDDLADAYLANSRRVTKRGQRVQQAAREAALKREGSFTDPLSGAEINQENRRAFEQLATKRAKDFGSISVSGANSKVTPDDEVRKFIPAVKQGNFFARTNNADSSLLGFAADATENLGADSLSSGELQDLNFAAKKAKEEVTLRKKGSGKKTTAVGDVSLGEFYRAQAVNQSRSPMARRVDGNRKAPVTDDFEKWAAAPSERDFQGVDTPQSGSDLFPEKKGKKKRSGFGYTSRKNRDREKVESAFEDFASLSGESQERLFGDTFDADVPFATGGSDSDSDGGGFEELL